MIIWLVLSPLTLMDFLLEINLKKKDKAWKEREKLSILVGGNDEINSNNELDLVNFLNRKGDKTETFVIKKGQIAPNGYSKIDLPFMDPTEHKGSLPKAFIAPKGIKIPDG